jgi:hypothetical protein
LGIVSTKPGFITGGYVSGTYPIALAGRVPTKVTTQNGAIAIGDALTLSQTPGVAMKATEPGEIVGIALEAYDGADVGSISVFVKPGWHQGALTDNGTLGSNGSTPVSASVSAGSTTSSAITVRSGLAKVYAGSTTVHISFPSIQAYPIVSVTPQGDAGEYWTDKLTDTGFDIVLKAPLTFDLQFTWSASPSQSGSSIFYSDNTSASYDPTSGNVYGPVLPSTSTSVTTSTNPGTATSTDPVVDTATGTPPVVTDTSSTTTSTTPPVTDSPGDTSTTTVSSTSP